MYKRVLLIALIFVFVCLTVDRDVSGQNQTQIFLPVLFNDTDEFWITEFMASNGSTIFDEDGESSDWLEIGKRGVRYANLEGYYLTDDEDNLTKWRFNSELWLAGGEHLLVYASGKNRTFEPFHTNFSLKSSGEYLALVRPDGQTIEFEYAPEYPPQTRDISYGVNAGGTPRYYNMITPGAPNPVVFAPIVRGVEHLPNIPADSDPLQVIATVEPSIYPVINVSLVYRVGFGNEVTIPMNGTGSNQYQATIPAGVAGSGDMIRYYVLATASGGHTQRWPLYTNPDNTPQYLGTVVQNAAMNDPLPVLHWFVQDTDAAQTRDGARATVFYNGRLYDNVFVRLRGLISVTYPKKSFKFEFNRGAYFEFDPAHVPVEEINLITPHGDTSYMRLPLAWDSYAKADVPSSISFPLRVERNNSFYAVYSFVEQPDETYLERNGLDPDGAFYKFRCCNSIVSATAPSVSKQTRKHEGHEDLQALVDGLNLDPVQRRTFMLDNVNIPAVINYLAATVVMQDYDYTENNFYLYRDTEDSGEWQFLPWDKDKTFGLVGPPDHPIYGHPYFGSPNYPYTAPPTRPDHNQLIEAITTDELFSQMYLRRLRTVMDEVLNPHNTPQNQKFYEERALHLQAQMAPSVALDADIWEPIDGFGTGIGRVLSHVSKRRTHLYSTLGPNGSGLIPAAQSGTPILSFGAIDPAPVSGDQDEEYLTIVSSHSVAIDISGWQLSNDVDFVFPAGTVIPAYGTLYVAGDAKSFRARTSGPSGGQNLLVVGDYKRNLDNEAGVVELHDTAGILVNTISHTTP